MNQLTSHSPLAMAGSQRKLSIWRLLLALVLVCGLAASAVYSWRWWGGIQVAAAHQPWFAAYVDATATPTYPFEELGDTTTRNMVLSFIVSSPASSCVPTWGGAYTLDQASASLDLDRRIARLRQQNGNIAVSFGGLKNNELAVKCTDAQQLLKAYQAVIERYNIDTIDLDLEGTALTNTTASLRRAAVIAELQSQRRAQGKSLAVWLTLPVTTQGLSEDGTNAVAVLLTNGVDIAGVNSMTMDFGDSRQSGQTMQQAAEAALTQVHRQLGVLYQQADIHLNSATLWSKMGATPMIGQNDIVSETFTVADARGLNTFAGDHGIGRLSMWSANRDVPCGENYVNVKVVSDSCSGVSDAKLSYATALSKGFDGDLTPNAAIVTTDDPAPVQTPDDPAKSPYQIWKDSGAYLQGTKVVWHHSVYEAKWWTQGDLPDNPVLQEWQTPWKLIGPVLPNEKPIVQPTLPAGTYPEWSGTTEYQTNQRVLFNGVPYQAKWWNQGASPAAASSNADSSPWVPLTQIQIDAILDQAQTK
jgi:chitinase